MPCFIHHSRWHSSMTASTLCGTQKKRGLLAATLYTNRTRSYIHLWSVHKRAVTPGSDCIFVKNKGIRSLYISASSSSRFFFFFWSWSQQCSVFDLRKSYYKLHCASLIKKQKNNKTLTYSVISGRCCFKEHHKSTVQSFVRYTHNFSTSTNFYHW